MKFSKEDRIRMNKDAELNEKILLELFGDKRYKMGCLSKEEHELFRRTRQEYE